MVQFPISEKLRKEACKHSAALFLVKAQVNFRPSVEYRNGTITFIRMNNIVYGVTCRHVIEALRQKIKERNDPLLCFATLVSETYYMVDRFRFPLADDPYIGEPPDIAIQQVRPGLCDSIGKVPIEIDVMRDVKDDELTHALAVGFPEENVSECERDKFGGYKLGMSCVHALAQIENRTPQEFLMHSDLDIEPETINLSGMSGGPIFWSNGEDHHLVGIVKEGWPTKPESEHSSDTTIGGGNRIHIRGERFSCQKFKGWASDLGLLEPVFSSAKPMNVNISISIDE